ncbi:hypothetical protein M0802_008393 [Mischocyttarus mexicanus]|nr:hypothetical protein M0802_008393 [Mischocyttarus mexicanus]
MSEDTVNKDSACSSVFKSNWSEHEKFLLLKSLKLYGHKNVAAISTFLSNKSKDEIEATINHLKSKSKITKKNTSSINDWLRNRLIKKKSTVIRQVLLFISLFEKNSSDNRMYDYREIYRYLYKLSCNMKNIKLSKSNQDILFKTLSQIDNKVTSTSQQDEVILHLEKLFNRNKNIKTYPGKKAANN